MSHEASPFGAMGGDVDITRRHALRPRSDVERTGARIHLAEMLEGHRDAIATVWLQAAGDDARVRYPDLDRYLKSLISGLYEVFRDDDWSLTQTIVDGLAERRARTGVRLEHGVQRALLAGRYAI
ncbi:MAG: RsbRD N-terminal domain-containing protein, partial [Actinomycetota bacterium]